MRLIDTYFRILIPRTDKFKKQIPNSRRRQITEVIDLKVDANAFPFPVTKTRRLGPLGTSYLSLVKSTRPTSPRAR